MYYEKPPPDKQMSSPSDSDTPRGTARRASDPHEGLEERKPVLAPPEMAMPDPNRMKAAQPPPPPPLPGSGLGDGADMPTQSELAKRLAEAQDTHSLAAHKIVGRLRTMLTGIAHLAEGAKHDLSDTVGARTIIVHGPTGTGKSTVVPWEAMRWLEDHCAERASTPGIVLCSQQRRKVTISLAEEVRKRHGEVGHAVVGFHVSRNRNAGPATRLMYVTEAIGVYALINNRDLKPAQPVTIVVADEVHERTMYTQMIIGLARTQMKKNPTMILILMSATVDVAELKLAIPGAQDIEIDQHEYKVSRFFLLRDITKLTNVLELTARLIVTMHHEKCDQNLVDGVPEGKYCDHFLVFCPGKPQIRALANLLIRWQELGYTRGLEVVPMYSGESPETWQYFDQPVSGTKIFGKQMPYYMSEHGIQQLRGHDKDGTRTQPPIAKPHIRKDIAKTVKRYRKVGLTTNVNQTGATLTSVAVVISTTGVRMCSPNLRSREDVNCIQTVSVSDLIQQGGRSGRVAPGKHVIVASEEQVQRQFRGPSTPELLNADIAPLLSVCKKVGIAIEEFPTLNAPDEVVVQATAQRMRMLDMIDDKGHLTPMGQSKLSFDFSPEWARTLAKAREYGVLEGAVKVAAVLSREDELCTMNTLDRYNHPDGDIMSLLQAIDLVEGILKHFDVRDIRDLPWKGSAIGALGTAGFKYKTVMQIWQNIAQIGETMGESGLPQGRERPRTDRWYGTLLLHAFWEGFHAQVMLRGITGKYASPVYGGEWGTGRSTLAYSPLVMLPLKKTIIDGNPVLQWLMPIPVEWLIERDWWIQTHWEDGDSREVYRQLLRSPIMRDMVSTTRLHPGARAMVVHIDQIPEPEGHKPTSADVYTVSLAHHRFLIPSQELEIVYDVMSADYLLDMTVNACFGTMEMVKTEMTMRVILWNVSKDGKKKLHKVDKPAAQELKTVCFQSRSCYDWDHQAMRLRRGDDPKIRATLEDEILLSQAGSAQAFELEDTNMYQTDTRDQAADRDAEAYEGFKHFRTSQKIEADVPLFIENPRLAKMRQGVGIYGYCAWCDAGMSNPTSLWNHYQSVHSVSMQVAPYTPPSVWQTLLGREMGARIEHFAAPSKELKYWVTPAESDDWSTLVEGISRNGPSYLVGVTELNLTSEGLLPRVDIQPAVNSLNPFQVPPNSMDISIGRTEDYWRKATIDQFQTLSIGTAITSEMAFMTMFNERGVIDGGLALKTDDYGSERLYGPKRYPVFLRMLSKEVDDVMVQKKLPLDVLTTRVPHCSMPAPEAVQMKVTTAYMFSQEVASAYAMASLDARKALGLADCSTGPEMRIFDHLWRGKKMQNSVLSTQGFDGTWGLVADNNPQWYEVLHVDQWYDAQHVQRQGVSAVPVLRKMSDEDDGRRIWPIAISAMKQQNTGSSNAVQWGVSGFPWSGSGFHLERGMSATYQGPTGKRVSLVAAAQSPGSLDPGRGSTSSATSSTTQDAGTSSMPPPSVPSSALPRADTAGSAACSQGSVAGQAPAAKGPPALKTGGTPMVQGPPVRPSSDSAVMAKAGSTDPQAKGPLQGQFPTPAESVGKSAPVKKPPPTGKPKQRASSLSLKAAYACMSGTGAPSTASPRGPAAAPTGQNQPATPPPSKEKTPEEKGEEMMKKKQGEKDPGRSYTTMVMQSLRDQSHHPEGSKAGSWEEQKKAQQAKNMSDTSTAISKTAVGTAPLPSLLMGTLLNPQPYESPVEGWVEGVYHPARQLGRIIELPILEAAGVFQWTSLGEAELQTRPKLAEVPLPNPDALGIDTVIYFWEKTFYARIPWNEGLKTQILEGNLGGNFQLDPNHPVAKEGRVPMLDTPSYLSDVNKIAWVRAFLGWAYRCVKNRSPEGVMTPHTDLVHFITELYANVSVPVAKPLSECGQGIPVYAAGAEIRTGSDGLMTSDWGNEIFIEAAKKLVPGIFVQAGDSKSDRGDRIESLFNISFWVKERAIDWSWLGLDTPGKERDADSLAVAIEWQCFKISERALIDFFMDAPWSASMAVLRVLQMCEEDDLNILQMPKTCPWCHHALKLEGMSLYMQIYTYLEHARTGKGCTNTYTGILEGSEVNRQAFPNVRELLSVKDKKAIKDFESPATIVYISGKGHRQWPSVAETTMVFIAKCVGKAREEFIRQLAALRMRQKAVQKEDDNALREAAREASRRKAMGEEPGEPVTLADIQKAAQKTDPLRYWEAPFRWGPRSRYGPPLERLIPLMSTTEVLTVPVSGTKVEAEKLWPECYALGSWTDAGEPERWEDLWKQRNNRPHDVWVTQGVGIGLPVIVPMAADPRTDRFLMDQLVDTGSRTVEGLAAMNGEMFRRLGDDHPGKGSRAPFEAAYQNLKKLMGQLRANPKADFNHEKTMEKLRDEFTAFPDKKGNPHDEVDDGVDFDPDEEVLPDNSAKPETPSDEPEYEDMVDGPLPERGLEAGPKYLGSPRFPWAAVWAPPAPLQMGLEGKKGFSSQYTDPKGQFTTVTRVVSATADGKPKVLLSYMREALSVKESRMSQPWKSSEAREKMFLMKLRVMETPQDMTAFGWATAQRTLIPPDQDRDYYFPQYVPVRELCSQPEFCVTWVRKVQQFRVVPEAIRADPPPLSTGILFGTSMKELVDPYNLYPDWDGERPPLEEKEPQWKFRFTAFKRDCALCPGVKCFRLLPCVACENWVHLECSYGIPEGRLCAAHCQILDPRKGVVVSDFQCAKNELRCLVPWRPWVKKYRREWWDHRNKRMREMHDLLPNVALEKHAITGAGLTWKRIHGSSTGIRPEQKQPGEVTDKTPWKALPLIPVWDQYAVPTYHQEFDRHKGDSVLTQWNQLTIQEMDQYNEHYSHGMRIRDMDTPYLLSPPALPVEGATSTDAETVQVLAFHGITYSHKGLSDPAIMPEYVRQVRENHIAILRFATLEPALPRWAFLRKGFSDRKGDLLDHMAQAYSRPTGKEKSMVFNDQTQKWEPEPVEEPTPGKGESTEKQEKTEKGAKLKRRSETEGEEPQAKKGSITSGSEVVKPVELKPATSVSTAVPSKKDKEGQETQAPTVESEKRPHTPRSGIVLKTAEEVQQQQAGEKAPHGQSSDEADDADLADQLQKASSVAGTSRKGHEGSDGPRSVDVVYDDGMSRTLDTSSKATVSVVEDDPYAPTQVSVVSSPEEAGKRRRKVSKSRLAKKSARTRRKGRPSPQSIDPEGEDEEEEGLDPELFKGLQGVIPEQDAQEMLVEVTGLAQRFKAQSVSAKSRASRMENLMFQACREAAAAREEAEEDKRLLRSENKLLKRTLGLVAEHQPAMAKSAARSARRASDSRGEDPDVRSRPPSRDRAG